MFLSLGSTANFSDNYFDMLPNTQKTVTIKKRKTENLESFKSKLSILTLTDTFTD